MIIVWNRPSENIQFKKSLLHVCNSFQRAADGGGINMASNWQILPDKRNWKHVIDHYIKRGLVFNDPRRPDLIEFYLREIASVKKKTENHRVSNYLNNSNSQVPDLQVKHQTSPVCHNRRPLQGLKIAGYYRTRLATCDFYVSCSQAGLLDFSDVKYRSFSDENMIPITLLDVVTKNKQYQEIEITHTSPGEILDGDEPVVTVTKTYFVRVATETPDYKLDFTEIFCFNGKNNSLQKCQADVITPNIQKPLLRLTDIGQVLLDDEMLAPSFFQLNEKWWTLKDIEEEIAAKANRSNRYVALKVRQELQTDALDWQGPNVGVGMEEFPQGGDYARHLEALGSYRTGLANGYGDVWLDRSEEELEEYIMKKEQEDSLIQMASLEDSWTDLSNMLHEKIDTSAQKNIP